MCLKENGAHDIIPPGLVAKPVCGVLGLLAAAGRISAVATLSNLCIPKRRKVEEKEQERKVEEKEQERRMEEKEQKRRMEEKERERRVEEKEGERRMEEKEGERRAEYITRAITYNV